MSKQSKIQSERKHKIAFRFLQKQFPDCTVTYDGVQGIDCFISHLGKTIPIEIKTCRRLVKNNLIRIKDHPILYSRYTLGQFEFNGYQQEELLHLGGWYVFMVGESVIFGVKASELDIKNVTRSQQSWIYVIQKSYPNWIDRLRREIYETTSE